LDANTILGADENHYLRVFIYDEQNQTYIETGKEQLTCLLKMCNETTKGMMHVNKMA